MQVTSALGTEDKELTADSQAEMMTSSSAMRLCLKGIDLYISNNAMLRILVLITDTRIFRLSKFDKSFWNISYSLHRISGSDKETDFYLS